MSAPLRLRLPSAFAPALLVAFAALLGGEACQEPPARAPEERRSTPASREIVGWVLPYENSLQSLARNAAYLTVVSPTYFRLAVSGKTARLEDWDPGAPFPRQRLATALAGSTASVLPLVGCIGPCGPGISRILDDDAARSAHVADLLRVTKEERLAGLVVDYEDVDAKEPSVSRFVEELASGLHSAGKRLVLVVQEPCGFDPACRRDPYPFALHHVTELVDRLIVMEYDYVVDGTGPPAPRAWIDRGLRKVLADVGESGREKVVCGLPLYGRITQGLSGDTAVLFDDVKASSVRDTPATIGRLALDADALSKVAKITAGARSGTLYLEDRETFAARVAHLEPFRIGGVALWRLGGEDPCLAPELAKLRGLAPRACP